MMEVDAICAAAVSNNGSYYILMQFQSLVGHLMGEVPKEFGEFERDAVYHIAISRVDVEPK